jgi:repressor LexA
MVQQLLNNGSPKHLYEVSVKHRQGSEHQRKTSDFVQLQPASGALPIVEQSEGQPSGAPPTGEISVAPPPSNGGVADFDMWCEPLETQPVREGDEMSTEQMRASIGDQDYIRQEQARRDQDFVRPEFVHSNFVQSELAQSEFSPLTGEALPGLSFRQQHILNYIRSCIAAKGYPPSMREIGAEVGLTSPSSVKHQLDGLVRKGYLRRDPNRPRANEVIDPRFGRPPLRPAGFELQGSAQPAPPVAEPSPAPSRPYGARPEISPDLVRVPLVGRIAAGWPILADQREEDMFTLPRQIVGEGNLFLLKVSGDSMKDAAILNGDYVVIRQQRSAENGDIVAALLDDEATVKTYRRDRDHIWLLPANEDYEPILGDHATVLGRVVSVFRSL